MNPDIIKKARIPGFGHYGKNQFLPIIRRHMAESLLSSGRGTGKKAFEGSAGMKPLHKSLPQIQPSLFNGEYLFIHGLIGLYRTEYNGAPVNCLGKRKNIPFLIFFEIGINC